MSSGLAFNENYGEVSDVTRMLYLEPDMAAFVFAKPLLHRPSAAGRDQDGTDARRALLPTSVTGCGGDRGTEVVKMVAQGSAAGYLFRPELVPIRARLVILRAIIGRFAIGPELRAVAEAASHLQDDAGLIICSPVSEP